MMSAKRSSTLSAFNHKSSVLCPSSTHITSQYLALEQLKAHQNMLSRSKGSVDTSAPKSLQSFISGINRRKKSHWNQELQYPSYSAAFNRYSRRRTRSSCDGDSREILNTQEDHLSTSLNKSIQTAAPFPEFQSKVADKISWYLEAVSQGEFQPPANHQGKYSQNGQQRAGSPLSLSSSLRSGRIVKGDLMEWHKDSFTSSPRPFSPRILVNKSARSKVVDMRCYNPPKKRHQKNSVNSSDTYDSFEDDEDDDNVDDDQEDDAEEESQTNGEVEEEEDDPEDEDDKIEENIEIEAPFEKKNAHEDWLKEQALRAQIRQKLRTKARDQARNVPVRARHFRRVIENAASNPFSVLSRDEEEKYLKFLCDVTEDILRSGIYTDNAIERTFQFHLQLCSKDADKERLQQLFTQVLSGLQLPMEANPDTNCSSQMLFKSPTRFHLDATHKGENMDLLTSSFNQMDVTNSNQKTLTHHQLEAQDASTINIEEPLVMESQPLEPNGLS